MGILKVLGLLILLLLLGLEGKGVILRRIVCKWNRTKVCVLNVILISVVMGIRIS